MTGSIEQSAINLASNIGGNMFNDKLLLIKKLPSLQAVLLLIDTSDRRKMAAASRKKMLVERSLSEKICERDLPPFLCETLGKAT